MNKFPARRSREFYWPSREFYRGSREFCAWVDPTLWVRLARVDSGVTAGRWSNKSSSAMPQLDWDTLSPESSKCKKMGRTAQYSGLHLWFFCAPFGRSRDLAMAHSDRTAKSKLLDALEKLHRNLARAFDQE